MTLAAVLLAAATAPPAVDHSLFDALLKAHVQDGLVDYGAFARSSEFARYQDLLSRTDPGALPREEALALWINAYNAYTIHLINAHDERTSIRNIKRALRLLRLGGPWSEPIAKVGGRTYTLDQIEHEVLRRRFREPRIHFVLVCAALGCPPLRSEAYTGPRLERQLDEQTRAFLRDAPRKNRVDVAARRVHLSPIFDWYKDDFGTTPAAVGRYLAPHFDGAEKRLLESGAFEIAYTEYDWALNARR